MSLCQTIAWRQERPDSRGAFECWCTAHACTAPAYRDRARGGEIGDDDVAQDKDTAGEECDGCDQSSDEFHSSASRAR